jgi:hypothetical protein
VQLRRERVALLRESRACSGRTSSCPYRYGMTEYERETLREQRLKRRQEARQHMQRQRAWLGTLMVTAAGVAVAGATLLV